MEEKISNDHYWEDNHMNFAVIGGGPGGYEAAIRAAQLGAQVTLIEKEALGGTCLNVGCIPTKALIHSADLYREIKGDAARNGIIVGDVAIDFGAMQKKKATVVKQLVSGVDGLMKANGIQVVKGTARFKSEKVLEVSEEDKTEEISADKILIASGSVPSVVPIPGRDLEGVVDSSGALALTEIPSSMCIIGGGVIGIEMAHIYQSLGTKITIVEMLPDILMNLDSDLTAVIKRTFRRAKTNILLETKVDSIEKTERGLAVHLTDREGAEKVVEAEKVLMCVGRRAATESLGLETIGVATERGKILVDENFKTNVENVYAIGDCIGGIMLAHVASAEGIAAVESMMGLDCHIDFSAVPSCVYTSPELAGVGLTEKQAKEQGISYSVGSFPLVGNGKSRIIGDTSGLVKIIADQESGRVLGFHMAGPSATELVVEGALAIHKKATVEDLVSTIHAHPSVGESIHEAAHAVFGAPINMPPEK
jgi:dihydrolipoamide dehydrogenase